MSWYFVSSSSFFNGEGHSELTIHKYKCSVCEMPIEVPNTQHVRELACHDKKACDEYIKFVIIREVMKS